MNALDAIGGILLSPATWFAIVLGIGAAFVNTICKEEK